MQVAERISALEAELRRSKRREEKLAALQYRLREDLKQNQGDIRYPSKWCLCLNVLHSAAGSNCMTLCNVHPQGWYCTVIRRYSCLVAHAILTGIVSLVM